MVSNGHLPELERRWQESGSVEDEADPGRERCQKESE